MIGRRALLAIVLLVLISPLFGVVLADMVGYHEPLDVAAEKLGLKEASIEWTPFSDYSIPGLPSTIGYIIAGLIGVGILLGIGYLLVKVVAEKK